MVNRFIVAGLLLLSLFLCSPLRAQPSEADRKLFAQTKAKADKGDAAAQLTLGDLYSSGIGVAKDSAKAAKWHRKAAEQGLARAQYQLALDFAEGDGVKADKTEAARWYSKAAAQGMLEAEIAMGICCLDGEGVKPNSVEAVQWFRKAADQGSVEAEYQIGRCYMDGTGVTKDLDDAIKYIRHAAERGFAPAQNTLGECYEKGTGVTKDYAQAYKWFALAAAHDDAHSLDIRVSLAKMESFLTKEQVAEAQLQAHEFKAVDSNRPAESQSSESGAGTSAGSSPKPAESSSVGFVNVLCEDERSEVYADGEFVGNPPAKLKLKEGRHVIEVKKTGCKSYQREIKVSAGSDLTLRAALEKE